MTPKELKRDEWQYRAKVAERALRSAVKQIADHFHFLHGPETHKSQSEMLNELLEQAAAEIAQEDQI